MPKKIDYPRASFKACLDLAGAVENLGGSCDMGTCAAKLNRKPSGAFHALIGAATKFGLITRKQGKLYVSDMYNKMKLSYTEEERKKFLQDFFLSVPAFEDIYSKYNNVKLPIEILDKALVKEFGVDKKLSGRVAKYFIDGAREIGLLNSDNTFNKIYSNIIENGIKKELATNNHSIKSKKLIVEEDYSGLDLFVVHIYGKGMNSKIEVNEIEDLSIVTAMINKIKKNLNISDK